MVIRRGRWGLPDGAVLTGLLVGGLLSSFEPWYVAAAAAAVGIAAKHLVRVEPNAGHRAVGRVAAAYLLAGVLAGNVFEALRRRMQGRAVAVRLVPPSRHQAREAAGTINFQIQ